MYQFSLCPNSRANDTMPITRELFNRVLDSAIVAETCRKIADQAPALNSPDTGIKERAQKRVSELKRALPSFCWHAAFNNGKRRNNEAVPSGLAMLDFDHIDDPQATFEKVKDTAISLNLVAAHVTPSCAGLRLVFAMPANTTIANFQAYIALRLNIPGFDACVHDLARISYAVTRPYWLYIDEEALFGNKRLTPAPVQRVSPNEHPATPADVVTPTPAAVSQTPVASPQKTVAYDKTYKGIPYEKIVFYIEQILGGKPVHGNRNMTIFSIAANLRPICNNDPDWLATIIPDYGESRDRWYSTLRSACNRPLPAHFSQLLVRALEMARNSLTVAKSVSEAKVNIISAPKPPEMPEELPELVAHLISNTPEVCRPAVSHGIFPALATHLHGVKFELIDGSDKEATFICINIARQSSGKSAINKPTEFINADIKERDDMNRKREQEWKDACNANKGKKDNPPRPTNLTVQILLSDITNAALVQKAIDAGDFPLYSNLPELDLLKQMQVNGIRNVGKFICVDYDNAEYGQERVGTQSVTGRVILRWNINASTTIQKGISFFRNNLLDGTLSRINFCTIIPDKTKEFRYGRYDEEYAAKLKPYITNLNLANGKTECEEALAFARTLQRRCVDMCEMADDDIMQDLIYRAVDIAYVKSMVLYIAQDMKWDSRIEKFIEWSLFYDLWCKNYFFGSVLTEANSQETVKQRRGQANLLDSLPNCFSADVVSELRRSFGMSPDARHILSVWVSRGHIKFNYDTEQYEKTEKYLSR